MDWQQHWYGHNRSFLQKCLVNGLVIGSLLAIYGVWIDFVASPLWWRWGSYLSIAVALFTFGVFCRGYSSGELQMQPGASLFRKSLGLIVLVLLLLAISWLLVVRVIPDTVTRMIGANLETTVPMQAVYSRRRRHCEYRLKGEILARAYPRYLCTSASAFASFPSEVAVTLSGKQTALGMHIAHFEQAKSARLQRDAAQ